MTQSHCNFRSVLECASRSQFHQPPLPYAVEQLEPYLSAEALRTHYEEHDAFYLASVNSLVANLPEATGSSLEAVIEASRATGNVRLARYAAQLWNHSFFWRSMSSYWSVPGSHLLEAINRQFGSFDALGHCFIHSGISHFGSGWVWLLAEGDKLSVVVTHDAETPIRQGVVPLLVCDVWEHAYYLDYQHDRMEWIVCWWERLANWDWADRQYTSACKLERGWSFPVNEGC